MLVLAASSSAHAASCMSPFVVVVDVAAPRPLTLAPASSCSRPSRLPSSCSRPSRPCPLCIPIGWRQRVGYYVPSTRWLPHYARADLLGDLIAGATVAFMLIPQGLSFASLAGLPPVYGLYTSFFPLLVFPFLSTSKYVPGTRGTHGQEGALYEEALGEGPRIGPYGYWARSSRPSPHAPRPFRLLIRDSHTSSCARASRPHPPVSQAARARA